MTSDTWQWTGSSFKDLEPTDYTIHWFLLGICVMLTFALIASLKREN